MALQCLLEFKDQHANNQDLKPCIAKSTFLSCHWTVDGFSLIAHVLAEGNEMLREEEMKP